MKKQFTRTRFAVPVLTAMVMAACNGGGDLAGIGGSGFISTGTITGFGSVYVNGVRFETDQARFEVEGVDGTQDDLRVGMVVQVQGSLNADGSTGTASFIRYADDLQGPVSAIETTADPDIKRLTVLGQTVVISASDTAYDDVRFDDIVVGQVLEISGYYDQNDELQASYVELKDDDDDVEIRGVIENLNGLEFTVRGIAVDASSASIEDFANGLQNGIYVEVEGEFIGNVLIASEVEAEDDLYDDDDEVEIEGYITQFTAMNDFAVNGVPVDASGVSTSLQLRLGERVEVEGYMRNGVLIAEEIELRGGNTEISARLEAVDLNSQQFTLKPVSDQPAITVQISDLTRMEDDLDDDDRLLLTDLQPGNFITVRGFEMDSNIVAVTRVKREDDDDDEVEVQGVVDAYTPTSVTVLGVEFMVDGSTEYEGDDGIILDGPADFDDAFVIEQTVVSIEDDIISSTGMGDGIADEIEIEDDGDSGDDDDNDD